MKIAMPAMPRSERRRQNRGIARSTDPARPGNLGYRYLGGWNPRDGSRAIETALLREGLATRGFFAAHISAAQHRLESAADLTGVTLYQANQRTEQLLRYGVSVQVDAAQPLETVHLIDGDHPEQDDFALAEEVTPTGGPEQGSDEYGATPVALEERARQ